MMKSLFVDTLKNTYGLYVKMLSKLFVKGQVKKQIVYLLSFPNNDHGLLDQLSKDYSVVVIYTKNRQVEADQLAVKGLETYCLNTFSGLLNAVKVISQSRLVIADNYFPFLGSLVKHPKTKIIQLWHATGAIKKFGLEDKSIVNRSKTDRKRFNQVYQSYDYYLVGSKTMGTIFKNSYGAKESQILYTGFPRTDYLHQATKQVSNREKVVYLPTYRENQMPNLAEEMFLLRSKLPQEMDLLIKTHPTMTIINQELLVGVPGLKVVDNEASADELLLEADCLLTDYSSVAFDYALVNPLGKLIFYWYDSDKYEQETGIQEIFKKDNSIKIGYNIDQVADYVMSGKQDLSAFNDLWNTYNDGQAAKRLVDWIREMMGNEHE